MHPPLAKKSRPSPCWRGRAVAKSWLGAWLLLAPKTAPAQEALQSSLAGDAAAEAKRIQLSSQPYTVKTGDLRLLLVPSLGLDWNDNIGITQASPQADFILRPMLHLAANYPLTQDNWFTLNADVGYDDYLQHSEYSGPRLLSGSELAFDFYVKDFHINLHDRSKFTEDAAGVAAIAATGRFGGLDNSLGPEVTWDLQDVVLTLIPSPKLFPAERSGPPKRSAARR